LGGRKKPYSHSDSECGVEPLSAKPKRGACLSPGTVGKKIEEKRRYRKKGGQIWESDTFQLPLAGTKPKMTDHLPKDQ